MPLPLLAIPVALKVIGGILAAQESELRLKVE